MKNFIKSAIVLFSESIWIYFIFALFISVEWDTPTFLSATWWIIAGILGYVLNRIVVGKLHYIVVLGGNAFVLVFLVIQNWRAAVPEESWVTGIFFSIAVGYVYVRSASFVYKKATRMDMLQRFEFSMFIYLALLFMYTFNDWINDYFHMTFLGAIFSTLLGMILTLDNDEKSSENKQVEVQKIGNPSGFIAVISVLFISVIVISSILFLPTVREKLQQFAFFGMDRVVWFFQQIGNFFAWIFSFFGTPEMDGALPEAEPQTPIDMGEMQEEVGLSLPIGWIFAGVGLIALILLLFVFGRFLKKWRPVNVARSTIKKESRKLRWSVLKEKIQQLIVRVKMLFRTRFARFYKREVYWYFQKVQKWGKKQGLLRGASETTGEYVEKLIRMLEETDVPVHEKNQLVQGLRAMNRDYQAAYYGDKKVSREYKMLLTRLKALDLKK